MLAVNYSGECKPSFTWRDSPWRRLIWDSKASSLRRSIFVLHCYCCSCCCCCLGRTTELRVGENCSWKWDFLTARYSVSSDVAVCRDLLLMCLWSLSVVEVKKIGMTLICLPVHQNKSNFLPKQRMKSLTPLLLCDDSGFSWFLEVSFDCELSFSCSR